ncbi:MAG: maleylpyruvate isomerase N-terminal domain-containing protein [Intrasporangium sp.]|uniref:maleylpyruvate isomerase N-terminal domain-containing protein n=1 Tax=Intrasporangium sp. TaxID=1925024 RepID=UPI002648DA29|nr:maleylpyruvate isomerase N-terminal domain-containing protein [Intrasporangium sp.]MDN5795702.1 maleylpyruvate isomerase N-terminal domain-containing protein [Intrasporangium sp.]
MSEPAADTARLYLQAATTFADLVEKIDLTAYGDPGLGVWDVRGLVGHTSRALVTVLTYLDQPADTEASDSPERYYALAARQATDPDAIAERGRRAGEDLGAQPAETIRDLVERTRTKVGLADPDALITVMGGGMRVRTYLSTRIFEVVVHSYDISAATGVDVTFPEPVLVHAAQLAARIAVTLGEGRSVLLALTGRGQLPPGFTVVG